jgi:uncharacterized membrane protein YqjE
MLGPARELARTLLSFAETRTRLAAVEMEEQAVRITEILFWVAASIMLLGIATVFICLVIVLAFWDTNRVLAAGLISALLVGGGTAAALIARARIRERPKFLAATLAELHQDKERLG